MSTEAPQRPAVRRRAIVGLAVSLGLIALLVLPLLAGYARGLSWARSRAGLLALPAAYFLLEAAFGRSVPELARQWDSLPRWQQLLCGTLIAAVVGGVFLWLLVEAAE